MNQKQKILIFGATGFIGSSLYDKLGDNFEITAMKINCNNEEISKQIARNDIIIHCSGVTRSEDESHFFDINFKASTLFFSELNKYSNKTFIYFSSIHFYRDDIYGYSKRYNEFLMQKLDTLSNSSVYCIRTPGIYGPGSKPNSVSVVSTFCYNIVNGIQSNIIDPDKVIELYYIDDLVGLVKKLICESKVGYHLIVVDSIKISVGNLFKTIESLAMNHKVISSYNSKSFQNNILSTLNHFKESKYE